jgi:acyl transferase domain-containing protein
MLIERLLPYVHDERLADLCFSANTGRDHLSERAAFVVRDAAALRAALTQRLAVGALPRAARRGARLAFMFGDGSPPAGVARTLFELEPVFRHALEEGTRAAASLLDHDLLPGLVQPEPTGAVAFPQCAGMILQRALHALLVHFGLAPCAVIGRGTGEYAAAAATGALSWPAAIGLVARRELLLASLTPGAQIRQTLHQLKAALTAVAYTRPRLPLVAASRARVLVEGELPDHAHWLDHLYATPTPSAGLAALAGLGADLVLELGSSDSFADAPDHALARERWLPTLAGARSDRDGHESLFHALGTAYERGAHLDWSALDSAFGRERLRLPGYPFQRQRHWLEAPKRGERLSEPPPPGEPRAHPLLARVRPRDPTRY